MFLMILAEQGLPWKLGCCKKLRKICLYLVYATWSGLQFWVNLFK